MKKNVRISGDHLNMKLVQFDANFFQERGMRSLDRFHYDKALKYFRKAVDYEPNNPINYCNIAGVLSEIGKYGESNQLLQKIIDEIDPDMTECHFYMANNFANMEFFEEAERELLQYLQEDEQGQFLEEAEEMIEYLELELERPTPLTKIKARAGAIEHVRARELLEAGQFHEGIALLESITEGNPEFFAARNNLALAYYYIGNTNDAITTLEFVLIKDPHNLHALCNLAIIYHYEGKREQLAGLIEMLRKIDPFYKEHLFKIATTMGILKEHQTALRHFIRLTQEGEAKVDPCISHFAAVAAFNIRKYDLAVKYWQLTATLDLQSSLATFYLIMVEELRNSSSKITLPYSYLTSVDEQLELWQHHAKEHGEEVDPVLKCSYLKWALKYGSKETKLKSLIDVELYCDEQLKQVLLEAVYQYNLEDEVKRVIVFALRSIGVEDTLEIVLNGKQTIVEAQRVPSIDANLLKQDNPLWEEVAQLVIRQTAKRYSAIEQHDMVTLWVNFLSKHYASFSLATKAEAWAAAIEYATAKLYNKTLTYHEASLRYGVSITTISKRVKEIDAVLGLKGKIKNTLWLVKYQE